MIFKATSLPGAWLIEPKPYRDDRGRFQRTFCEEQFREHGLATRFPQHSLATTRLAGTVRGMHFQEPPHAEVKVVRCVAGAIEDVIIDLRPDSPTFRRWQAFELTAENGHQVYVPEGFAHGCLALTDDATVHYMMSSNFAPEAARGVRPDDPSIGVVWSRPFALISERDRSWPLLA